MCPSLALIGELTPAGGTPDPAKAAFVAAVADALLSGPFELAAVTEDADEDGYHCSSRTLDEHDARRLALLAWYRHCRVPEPSEDLLYAEAHAAASWVVDPDPVPAALHTLEFQLLTRGWAGEAGGSDVTALLVQRLHGGELLRYPLADGAHYANRLPDGRVADLARGQFRRWEPVGEPDIASRAALLADAATAARYGRLLDNLGLAPDSDS